MPLFDTYVMVDWSAKNRPTTVAPQENAIWWAVHPLRNDSSSVFTDERRCGGSRVFDSEDKAGVEIYERTRHTAMKNIKGFLRNEVEKERRVLVGFDFAFGYPMGFAESITGQQHAPELWRALSVSHDQDDKIVISDDKKNNKNNRFDVAAELNGRIIASVNDRNDAPYGPFWGFPGGSGTERPPKDPYRKSERPKNEQAEWPRLKWPEAFGFKLKRVTDEQAEGSRSVFQLSGAGSVGSQAIIGMRYLHGLRCHIRQWSGMKNRCIVWPFDPGFSVERKESGPEIVIVEIYPSLVTRGRNAKGKKDGYPDREQVKENARAFGVLDARGDLKTLFDLEEILTPAKKAAVEREEGWILGAGRDDIIRSVAKEDSPLRPKRQK